MSNDLTGVNYASVTLKRDDAAVVYINGKELARMDLPAFPALITFTNLALTNVINTTVRTNPAIDFVPVPLSMLQNGSNLFAVEIHQGRPGDAFDMYFDLTFSTYSYTASPLLSISAANNVVTVSWPDALTNWTLEHSIDLNAWNAVSGTPLDTNGFLNLKVTPPLNPRDFFRLHQTNGP